MNWSFFNAEKMAKLPKWAQDVIKRLETENAPMVDRVRVAERTADVAQRKAARLSEANEALLEIIRSAGKGGFPGADEVILTLEGYSIFRDGTVPEPE